MKKAIVLLLAGSLLLSGCAAVDDTVKGLVGEIATMEVKIPDNVTEIYAKFAGQDDKMVLTGEDLEKVKTWLNNLDLNPVFYESTPATSDTAIVFEIPGNFSFTYDVQDGNGIIIVGDATYEIVKPAEQTEVATQSAVEEESHIATAVYVSAESDVTYVLSDKVANKVDSWLNGMDVEELPVDFALDGAADETWTFDRDSETQFSYIKYNGESYVFLSDGSWYRVLNPSNPPLLNALSSIEVTYDGEEDQVWTIDAEGILELKAWAEALELEDVDKVPEYTDNDVSWTFVGNGERQFIYAKYSDTEAYLLDNYNFWHKVLNPSDPVIIQTAVSCTSEYNSFTEPTAFICDCDEDITLILGENNTFVLTVGEDESAGTYTIDSGILTLECAETYKFTINEDMNTLVYIADESAKIGSIEDGTVFYQATRMHAAMVNGTLYFDYGEIASNYDGHMDGYIKESVRNYELPKEDDQCNFGDGFNYGLGENGVLYVEVPTVTDESEWHILRAEIKSEDDIIAMLETLDYVEGEVIGEPDYTLTADDGSEYKISTEYEWVYKVGVGRADIPGNLVYDLDTLLSDVATAKPVISEDTTYIWEYPGQGGAFKIRLSALGEFALAEGPDVEEMYGTYTLDRDNLTLTSEGGLVYRFKYFGPFLKFVREGSDEFEYLGVELANGTLFNKFYEVGYTPAVMVDGELYISTGEAVNSSSMNISNFARITSTVEPTEMPNNDMQSNFGIGYFCSKLDDGFVYVLFPFDGSHYEMIKFAKEVDDLAFDDITMRISGRGKGMVSCEITNESTEEVTLCDMFSIQKYEDGDWVDVVNISSGGDSVLPEDMSGYNLIYRNPEQLEDGNYRLVRTVKIGNKTHDITAEFKVADEVGVEKKDFDITMHVTDVDKGLLTVEFTNDSFPDVMIDDEFSLYKDGNYIKPVEDDPFLGTRARLEQGEPNIFTIRYDDRFGKLKPGVYTLEKTVYVIDKDNDTEEEHVLSAGFTVPESKRR